MKTAFSILLVLVGFLAGWYLKPGEIKTEIKYQDRIIVKRDTLTEIKPVEKIIYKKEVERDTVTIIKPIHLKQFNLLPPTPLKYDNDHFILTYFNPVQQRYEQNVYDLNKLWSRKFYYGVGYLYSWREKGGLLLIMGGQYHYAHFAFLAESNIIPAWQDFQFGVQIRRDF